MRGILLASMVLGCFAAPAFADEDTIEQKQAVINDKVLRAEPDNDAIFTLSFENDIFSGDDNNYTNGVRLAYVSPENALSPSLDSAVAGILPWTKEGRRRWFVEAGQNMYTPDDTQARVPDPDDQPYAGFLYGNFGVISDTGYQLDNLSLTLGVVGPASGADETQNFIHRTFGMETTKGWKYQLENEPIIGVNYEHRWRAMYELSPFGLGFDVTPGISASVGNAFTYAATGAVARLGYDLPSDYGPPLIRPSAAGSNYFIPTKRFGWYLFAGVEGRAVARNIFLDGNTFRDSPSVDKYPFIGGLQAGIAFTIGDTRVSYTHILRTKEFEGQRDANDFGALTVSWRF